MAELNFARLNFRNPSACQNNGCWRRFKTAIELSHHISEKHRLDRSPSAELHNDKDSARVDRSLIHEHFDPGDHKPDEELGNCSVDVKASETDLAASESKMGATHEFQCTMEGCEELFESRALLLKHKREDPDHFL